MRVRWVVAVLGLAGLLVCGVAQAGAAVRTVVAFDPAAGEFPEGTAVDVRGDAYVSFIEPVGEIRRVDTATGAQSVVARFAVPGLGPLGLAVSSSGQLYADVSTFDQATRGVYRIGAGGSTTRLPGTDNILFPNGLAFDARGDIYVTDSIGGAVWKIPPGGSAQVWFASPLLAGTGALGVGFPIGANGIAVGPKEVVVTNTEGARLVRIVVRPDGSAGDATVVADGPALFGADGVALDVFGNSFVALNPQNKLIRVDSGGSTTTLATAADGLDNPASVSFGTSHGEHGHLFVTNFSFFSTAPTPGLLDVDVGTPGAPIG